MELYQFTISHFCEKARWALDHKRVAYRQRTLVPGFHIPKMRRLTGRTTVPVLVDDGLVVRGSGRIIDHLDATHPDRPLTPEAAEAAERVRAREVALDRSLGVPVRQYAYTCLEPRQTRRHWLQGAPRWAHVALPVAMPMILSVVRKFYQADPGELPASVDALAEAVAELDAEYAARPWLEGGRFGRLDLTVASLLAPVVQPPEHEVAWGEGAEAWAPLRERLEGPTLARVRALYATLRRPVEH